MLQAIMDQDDEEEHIKKRLFHTLKNYQEDTVNRLSYMQKSLYDASMKHKNLLLQAGLGDYLENLLNCVEANQKVIDDIGGGKPTSGSSAS